MAVHRQLRRALPVILAGLSFPALATALVLRPGLYELGTTIEPGGPLSVTRTCFSAAHAGGDFARPIMDGSCTVVRDRVAGGRIDMAMECIAGSTTVVRTVSGTYTATTFDMVTRVRNQVGGSPKEMAFRTVGRRVRDVCIP